SLDRLIAELPADTTVYPGHGPNTTIRQEMKTNPFL
ncbi:MAG TPA: MBL fold metallo-hydrolase, partial [Exiguobacterium sp.]|nr:MBL fold metallo-hydrolase [Exiguobacterium sp.]